MQKLLDDAGIESVKTPPYSPNCNAFAERFVRTLRENCLNKQFFFSEGQLRSAMKSFQTFYNSHRNHQGIGNVLIDEKQQKILEKNKTGKIKKRDFGFGNYFFYRDAS